MANATKNGQSNRHRHNGASARARHAWQAPEQLPERGFARFWQLLREDWHTRGRDWTMPGFRALAVYRFGVWRSSFKWQVIRKPLSLLYLMMYRFVRNYYGIELTSTAVIGRRFIIGHQSGIVIHSHAEFGDDCVVRQNVTIGTLSIERPREAPKLGHRVEIGCGAAVLGPVTIGDDTRIGANVVVMTDIPPGSSVVCPPPRVVQLPRKTKNHGEAAARPDNRR